MDLATTPWGVLVERVEVKDVSVPEQLQRAMASEAEAAREARAKVIAAEGELQASRSLAHAAEVIVDCPEALQVETNDIFILNILHQLRFLQTLAGISENSNTIMFPLPLELISILANPGHGEDQNCSVSEECSVDYLENIASPDEGTDDEKRAGQIFVA